MSFTTKKYRVSVSFCRKQTFFGKTEDWRRLWILRQNLNFLKPVKTYI
jgi:hypothetical protein